MSQCRNIGRFRAATKEFAPPSTLISMVNQAFPPPPWGGESTRTSSFSARHWQAARCLRRKSMSFERVGTEEVWNGRIASVRNDRFRHADGEVVDREIVSHPGAVAVVAHDGEHVWFVKQPREAVDDYLVELPAGKLDEEGEDVLATAKRELAEEIGKAARNWVHFTTFWASPGFSDEQIHVYLATDLYDEQAHTDEVERIEILKVPLPELDDLIRSNADSKTLVGLLWFRAFGEGAAPCPAPRPPAPLFLAPPPAPLSPARAVLAATYVVHTPGPTSPAAVTACTSHS